MADEYMEQGGSGESGLIGRTIRVTPETLIKKAEELDMNAADVKHLTGKMTERALELTGRIWTGEAQTAFVTRIRALQTGIDQYTPILQKHASNLRSIASLYETTETEAVNQSDALPGSIF